MQLKIYSIRDTKAEVFHPPFFQKSHGEAERSFSELLRDEKSLIYKYPEDYDLYYLGNYDDQTGKITPNNSPEHQLKAVQISLRNNAAQNLKQ